MNVVKVFVVILLGIDLLVSITDGERLCSCYAFGKGKNYWPYAKKFCEKSNKTLVVIETEQEWQFITFELLNKTGKKGDEWFIGLEKATTARVWTWINGKPLTIDKWHKVGTNPDTSDRYGLIHKEYPVGFEGSLSTIKDHIVRKWICEEETATCRGNCFVHPSPSSTSPSQTSTGTKAVTTQDKTSTEQNIIDVSGSSTTVSTPTTTKTTDKAKSKYKALVDDNRSSSLTVVIVAASLGAVFFVVLIILFAVLLLRRKKRQGKDAESAPPKKSTPNCSEKYQLGESQYESVNPVEAAKLLGSANSTPEASPKNCEYAVVNKANKKRKEADLMYAQLADFNNETHAGKPPKPPSYEPTIYADVEELPPELPGKEDPDSSQPTYANLEKAGV
ncbi:uncharacterized protein LOC111318989 [Stylophora pistillata]|uniref:uncharacterized protein LOC111318989 n=1 Tax=Stylophora pistillata TaxID=50429 RepID=UPI000C043858|nr:uncharacterized protein LOC111318989 [Stylophora pistillata]